MARKRRVSSLGTSEWCCCFFAGDVVLLASSICSRLLQNTKWSLGSSLWVRTEGMRSLILAAKMIFLPIMVGSALAEGEELHVSAALTHTQLKYF